MKFTRLPLLSALSLLLPLGALQAQDIKPAPKPDMEALRAFIELARSDIRTEKALAVANNMILTADEAAEFWPLHREYEFELSRLLDQRIAIIEKFLPSADALSEAQAKELATRFFALEEERTQLKKTYFTKFCEVIPAAKAARFFQIENQLNLAIDLQVAALMPLIK